MKLSDIILEQNRYNDDGYDEGDIKLMGDMILPTDKMVVLQAEEDTYNRGLLVTSKKDKSYDVAYWADDKTKPYPIGIEIDGKEVAKDAKIIKFLFHPEMKEGKDKANEGMTNDDDDFNKELEDIIKSGIRLHPERLKDVVYYIHNNWMAGNYGDDYAIRRISKFLNS